MNPEIERWRKYLRQDPTRFLLDEEANPSVSLGYLVDIAHRPENSLAVIQAREHVLYSAPVQDIFAAQRPEGYWQTADSLVAPRHRATLWSLALLAELGIPRDSRRARTASEFALQNFLAADGPFRGMDSIETGYLIHALAYFNLADDARVRRAARTLAENAARANIADEVRVAALWGLDDFPEEESGAKGQILERLGDSLAERVEFGPITFPPFDPSDPLFILRVLSGTALVAEPRLTRLVQWTMQKQNERGQWPLEKSLSGNLWTRVEEETPSSRWATLDALRVIVRLVLGELQA